MKGYGVEGEIDPKLDFSSIYHLENPLILDDLKLNYMKYFNNDKNLMLDLGHQTTILETLRNN